MLTKILKQFYFYLAWIIIFLSLYINTNFYDISFEQLLYTVIMNEGTVVSSIKDGFIFVMIGLLIVFIIVNIIKYFLKKHKLTTETYLKIQIKNKTLKFCLLPLSSFKRRMGYVLFFIITILFSCTYLGIFCFIKQQTDVSTFFEDYYVNARDVEIVFPEEKRNLIYIYVESLENTNFTINNGGIISSSYTPNLENLALNNTNFSNTNVLGGGYTAFATNWTASALMAHTAGVPLKIAADYKNNYSNYGGSLPGVYNLGDILEKNGYHNYFMMGSNANFGGRRDYFTYHGDYEIFDYYWAIDQKLIDEDYLEWWGYEDKKLYSYAKDKLLEIASNNEPFNFTMLTADTHFVDGYLDDSCPTPFEDHYANAFNCTDIMLNDFINWIYDQDFYDNTTIIITGDHLTMQNDFYNLPEGYDRTVYNVFINTKLAGENNKNRVFTTMDMFPTTLASLGVTIEGNRLGLGTNLYSNKLTLSEELGLDYLNNELAKKDNFYNNYLLGDTYYKMEKETQ